MAVIITVRIEDDELLIIKCIFIFLNLRCIYVLLTNVFISYSIC